MNTIEWMWKEVYRTLDSEEAQVFHKFTRNEVHMTETEEKILQSYIDTGEQRQREVVEQSAALTQKSREILKGIAKCLMFMEPYLVFYKNYFLNTPTDFINIDDWVMKIQEWLKEYPHIL